MRRVAILPVLLLLLATIASAAQDDPPQPPIQVDKVERAEVKLVMLDTVVVDSNGEPVAGLTKEDFEIRFGGQAVTPDILETRCEEEGERPVEVAEAPPYDVGPRRIVLAFDYLHLQMMEREWALDTAMQMVRKKRTVGDEMMVVALTGGLRIEQPFTSDPNEVLASLKRMQKDITLWNGNFAHMSEYGFVRGVTSLFDVLGTASAGPKAVVFYSAMSDVPLDNQFERIAAVAATSRCALYTVDPYGLKPPDVRTGDMPSGSVSAAPG